MELFVGIPIKIERESQDEDFVLFMAVTAPYIPSISEEEKMKIEKLERALNRMPNKALLRFVKRCVCKILLGVDNAASEAREELDLVYVECSRRGQERLYDTAYASVSRHPERCDIF